MAKGYSVLSYMEIEENRTKHLTNTGKMQRSLVAITFFGGLTDDDYPISIKETLTSLIMEM